MAVITTTGNLIRQYNAFTGLSAVQRSQSGIARAEIVYYNVNDDWPVPGSGNSRVYTTGVIDLPTDFGYVLTDAYCKIDATGNLTCDASSTLQVRVGGTLGPQINMTLKSDPNRQDVNGSTAIGSIPVHRYNSVFGGSEFSITHYLTEKPSSIIYPFQSNAYTTTPNPASQWVWTVGEETLGVGIAYDVSVYFRFLQYDIDQSYNYVIQSPQLTR